jgi:hypothetical protein
VALFYGSCSGFLLISSPMINASLPDQLDVTEIGRKRHRAVTHVSYSLRTLTSCEELSYFD